MMKRKQKIWALILTVVVVITSLLYTPDKSVEEIKALYTNEASRFTPIQGMEVHYRREGKGPKLVLIHGTAASLHTWDDWTEALSADFEIIRLDMPAFGITGPRPDRDYSMSNYVSFLNEFLTLQGVDSFYLAGNSLGGAIAWNYTIQHPEKVKKLVLVDPSGAPRETETPFIFRLANTPVLSDLLQLITPRSIIASNIKQVYYDDDKISDQLITRYHDMALRKGNRQAFVDRARGQTDSSTQRLEEINCPTLIQWGRYDEWIPVEDAEFFFKKIPNSQLIIYENAGHVPMEEIPEETSSDVRYFLLSDQLIPS